MLKGHIYVSPSVHEYPAQKLFVVLPDKNFQLQHFSPPRRPGMTAGVVSLKRGRRRDLPLLRPPLLQPCVIQKLHTPTPHPATNSSSPLHRHILTFPYIPRLCTLNRCNTSFSSRLPRIQHCRFYVLFFPLHMQKHLAR